MFQKLFKQPTTMVNSIIVAVAMFVFGLVFIIWPQVSAAIVCYVLGAILCVVGIYNLGVYFSHGPEIGLVNYNFSKGLIALIVGVIIILKPELLAAVVPVVFGCALVVGGIVKLQIALDLFRMKHKFWYLPCIAAALIIAAGIVIICNPFTAFLTLMIFIGASLIAESIFDGAALILIKRLQKRMLS